MALDRRRALLLLVPLSCTDDWRSALGCIARFSILRLSGLVLVVLIAFAPRAAALAAVLGQVVTDFLDS